MRCQIVGLEGALYQLVMSGKLHFAWKWESSVVTAAALKQQGCE